MGVRWFAVSHQWDVAGEDDLSQVSPVAIEYFYVFNLSDGWQISATPTFSYNHEAPSGQEPWTLPVGFGVSKTTVLGGTPWKFPGSNTGKYVKQADPFGQDWALRFTVTRVILPWGDK